MDLTCKKIQDRFFKKKLKKKRNIDLFMNFMICLFYFMNVCAPVACSARSDQKSAASPGSGVSKGCESPCGCWESPIGILLEE